VVFEKCVPALQHIVSRASFRQNREKTKITTPRTLKICGLYYMMITRALWSTRSNEIRLWTRI